MTDVRWLLLFGVWLIYLLFGLVIASIAPLVPRIAADLGAGAGTMGLVMGAWPFVYILAALPASTLLDRIGVRRGLLIAVVVMAASALLRGMAGSTFTLALAVALFGVGGPLISVGAPKLIAELFQGRARGTAMGIYISGPAIGGITALSLTNSVLLPLAGGDWRRVMMAQAVLVLLGGAVWLAITATPAARRLLAGIGTAGKYNPAAFREVIASAEVRLVLAMAVAVFAINHGLNNWLPSVLMAKGMTATAAGYWAAVPSVVGIVAAVMIPGLARTDRQVAIFVALALSMLVATLLFQLASPVTLAVGLVLQGIARGTMMTLAMMLLMESRDVPRDRLGMAGGLFFTTAEIGGVLGPVVFGALVQGTGGFAVPVAAISAVCLALLGLLAVLARHRRWG